MQKDFKQRLEELRSNAKLLVDACDRFISNHDFDEVRNIGVRLRLLVGTQKGDGLLFDLAKQSGDTFSVMKLNQHGFLQITEIEHGTGRIVQQVKKRALFTQIPDRKSTRLNSSHSQISYAVFCLK